MAIIAISGYPGAGKTVLSDRLALFLNYKSYYTGGVIEDEAQKLGMSKEEYFKKMATIPALEIRLDARQSRLMMTEDNYVIQGRMAPFQLANPNFTKINILLTVSDDEGARRQLSRTQNQNKTLEQMIQDTRERMEEEKRRYKSLYGIKDHFDSRFFHIVLDTTTMTEDQVFEEVVKQLTPLLGLTPGPEPKETIPEQAS